MRFQPWMLLVAGTIAVVAAVSFAAISMGGDSNPSGSDATSTPTQAANSSDATPTQAADSNELGPAPVMTAHITEIAPVHGGQVKQAATRETNGKSGICATVNYKDLPENQLWFRMAVDDKEVTPELSLFLVGTQAAPEGATMCYAPKDGLTVGRHSAAIIVQNPNSTSGPPQETVAWKFDVVE